MRVLALVGSPRKLGNSEILAREMLAALPADTDREMIRLTELDIGPCRACYACLPADKGCVIEDDLAFLLARIKAADAVIIAAPVYFLGAHTSVKAVGDRLISILADNAAFAGKRCVAAVSYGIPGWEGYGREMVLNFARFLHLEVAGCMLVRAASPGEAARPEVLAEARALAGRLMGGEAELSLPGVHTCRECGSSLLQIAPSGAVRCVMCDARGELKAQDGKVAIEFAARGHGRFSPAGKAEHAALLEEIKRRYIAEREELFRIRKPYGTPDWWVRR
ncbi:flavodoxin family protein [Anaeroselena agilis]|uniref:Flavodoxin family protein n=1 Tax=Anaeroselena agilis TaxID=3063788 RepID=A0ABU3NV75_9FIRM|nr:flavodoxin family protein [Selenomonadales bacterium 4137-cl]